MPKKKVKAKKGVEAKKSQSKQVILLSILLLVLIACSVTGTLIALGVINLGGEVRPVHSMVDAEMICNEEVRGQYPEDLSSFFVDNHSSRFDENSNQYLMFYEINLNRAQGQSAGVQKYYANCFVSLAGRVKNFEMFKDKAFVPKAVKRRSGNAFGL